MKFVFFFGDRYGREPGEERFRYEKRTVSGQDCLGFFVAHRADEHPREGIGYEERFSKFNFLATESTARTEFVTENFEE